MKRTKPQGNIFDAFCKKVFGQILVFADFLKCYADPIALESWTIHAAVCQSMQEFT